MKTFIYMTFLVVLFQVTGKAQTSNLGCPNGDAEDNSLTNWSTLMATSTAPSQTLNAFTNGFSGARTGVHSSTSNYTPMLINGIDQYGLFAVPSQGAYCFRVGNNMTGAEADMMHYSFLVTPNNANFKFRYAVVLQDPGHTQGQNPSVSMYMNLGTSHIPNLFSPVDVKLFRDTHRGHVADLNNPYFKRASIDRSVVYKDWQCVEYDLTRYIGSTVSFNFMVRDCSLGGHFGYAYLDGLCTSWPAIAAMTINKTEFCNDGQPVMVDASASTGEDRWFLEVAEVDAAGNTVAGGDMVGQWFLAQQAPANINVSQFFASKNKAFKCGNYYRINIAVMNDCAQWNVQSRFIHFKCPPINAGPNLALCCGTPNPGTLNLGQLPAQPGFSYQWHSFPAGFTSSLAQTSVPIPSLSTAYILTVTDALGCKATDSVIVRYHNPNMRLSVTKNFFDGYQLCDLKKYYSANVTDADCPGENPYFANNYPATTNSSIQWQFQNTANNTFGPTGTGPDFAAPNADGITQTRISNACVTLTHHDNVQFKQSSNSLIAPNSFAPNGGNNPIFQIFDYGVNAPPRGQGPAYNAVDFRLYIIDRNGNVIKKIEKDDVGRDVLEPLKNGDIQWDGKDKKGSMVPFGTYNYFLNLQYCNSGEYVPVCIEGTQMQSVCFDYTISFGGLNFVCNDRRKVCVGAVTVLR